jgi:hypothetical protein
MFKSLLLGIGLLGLAVASAKSYHITLTDPRLPLLLYDKYRILISWSARYEIWQGVEVGQTHGFARWIRCSHRRSGGRGAGQRQRHDGPERHGN